MKIRGLISHEVLNWGERADRPIDEADIQRSDQSEITLNPDLFSPEGAQRLAIIREHCIDNPQGILLDVYQAVTELELKHPSGSPEANERYTKGLREETMELSAELEAAQLEHPYRKMEEYIQGPSDFWLTSVLDENRLRFNDINPERKDRCLGEMGDILWYSSRLAAESGIDLSSAFLSFLRSSGAGTVRESYSAGLGEEMEQRAKSILDFRLVQDISLSQKLACTERIQVGTSAQKIVSIDNAPYILLNRIIEDDLSRTNANLEMTIGKLVWFIAYTSSSILNADFAIVMQSNLEKITARSRRGTIFSKNDRNELDESQVHAEHNTRVPLGYLVNVRLQG